MLIKCKFYTLCINHFKNEKLSNLYKQENEGAVPPIGTSTSLSQQTLTLVQGAALAMCAEFPYAICWRYYC